MNILFVSAVLPYPLYSGGQIRIFNLLKRLSQKHSIHLYSFIRDETENEQIKNLSFCASVTTFYRGRAWRIPYIAKSLTSNYSFLLSTYDNAEMKHKIESDVRSKKIDIVHIEPGYVWPSLPKITKPIIVAEHNIEHSVYMGFANTVKIPLVKQYLEYDVQKMMRWETKIWNLARHIVAVSETDAEYIAKNSSTKVSVVPNAVDLDTFKYKPKEVRSEKFVCLFVGNFRWMQNRDAIKSLLTNIWPKVSSKFPNATLRIVGQYFPEQLKKYSNPNIELVENASEIASEYHTADIMLAPIVIGGGTKYKILEAMACGLTVISTKKGVEGLPFKNYEHCYVVEQEVDWINFIEFILSNPNKNNTILKKARSIIEENYDWKNIANKLDMVWKSKYD